MFNFLAGTSFCTALTFCIRLISGRHRLVRLLKMILTDSSPNLNFEHRTQSIFVHIFLASLSWPTRAVKVFVWATCRPLKKQLFNLPGRQLFFDPPLACPSWPASAGEVAEEDFDTTPEQNEISTFRADNFFSHPLRLSHPAGIGWKGLCMGVRDCCRAAFAAKAGGVRATG